ncbi:error-prone DNA polymerase [Tanticharoenia sakaeratensis]|uniref:Error-prone DNA polymerase n=1 Tax=Tanticharoenia sakaeratensis NBRC 103193 TaxID=1231623 RepID=A0A0D6MKV4_9PROT|nr:error-prone DNA polymerase [Tanticharoenia sakaeratensis]GAN54111.1 DNA polymerase III alpha subunit [Tanticharoenia sakaeratensis NBRC 103193]GBQ24680.1 DNA polymerase III subunit alpha [Tanticharoenia sakaeratensis NBRC 103193]
MSAPYAELQVTSYFSFLRGASSCDELFVQAQALGISALGLADRHSLAGVVRAHVAAKATGVRLVIGARIDPVDFPPLLLYPTDRAAYGRLCRLLTLGKSRGGKGQCRLGWQDVMDWSDGLIAVLLPDTADDALGTFIDEFSNVFRDRAYLALTLRRRPNDQLRLHELGIAAHRAQVPTVVTNDVLYHDHERRILQDVVTCIRHNVVIDHAGYLRERHADRYLKPPAEMARLFARYPEALSRTQEIVARCRFSLDDLAYQYPDEVTEPGMTPQQRLEALTWAGAGERYPDCIPDKVRSTLEEELQLIGRMDYAPYFLTVHSIVAYAKSQQILCQGRGSAANSAVCYVLGITAIDPAHNDMLFERFVSEERREPPDIDVDFEHERREEIIQWVYRHYGRERAALTAVVSRYRARGALRDVGKALGLTEDVIRHLSAGISQWSRNTTPDQFEGEGVDLSDRRIRLTLQLAQSLLGAPRHLSQHPGGFVLTHDRLDELVPVEPAAMDNRQIIEWDKDDIDVLKFMKVDCLALGMLTCLRRGLDLLQVHKGITHTLSTIEQDDEPTYEMIRRADTVGVFQIESRAQMSMLPRLKPENLYDLTIEIAIVRPGPIQGDMVHPYLRRREGLEKPEYPTEDLWKVLRKTLGVPLFQEQAMRVAMVCAGFSASEADQLRRAMATFKNTGTIERFRHKLVEGMADRGYSPDFAMRIYKQLEGFGSYGFPESHAASFAILAYISSWLKCHYPDVFLAALLNSQPMGFYSPAQLVRDARDHGVVVRPICIVASRWDSTLEPGGHHHAVRLGMSLVKGLSETDAARLIVSRDARSFADMDDLKMRGVVPVEALVRLAEADAFQSAFGLVRRAALWAIRAQRDAPLPLFAAADAAREIIEPAVDLAPMRDGAEVVRDYDHVGLSLRGHPVAFLRPDLACRDILSCADVMAGRDGRWAQTAGVVLVRQRPGSGDGVCFITLEDETGTANLVVWPDLFETFRRIILSATMMAARGRIQREGRVVHLVVRTLEDLSPLLADVGNRDLDGGRVERRDAQADPDWTARAIRSRNFH